ncbi:MAG: hypothetical protein CME35_13740, partial [Gramella sp.]|nr:hypothetical protein [Christiangramia sp.]
MKKITCFIGCYLSKRIGWLSIFFVIISQALTAQAPDVTDGLPTGWPAVTTNYPYPFGSYIEDLQNDSGDDIWTQGSADVDNIPDWTTTTNTSNDKNDLKNTGAVTIGNIIYFFADRYGNNGDSDLGYWLLQGPVSRTATGFTGTHHDGDVLLRTHFVNGGAKADRAVFIWLNGQLEEVDLPISALDFKSNPVQTNVPSEWTYDSKSEDPGVYPPNSFVEGFLNLAVLEAAIANEFQFDFDPCFSYFVISTGNSQSPNSSLEDLVTGQYGSKPGVQELSGNTLCTIDGNQGVVTLADSEINVSYQLQQLDNSVYVDVGSPQQGTGGELSFMDLAPGNYYVKGSIGNLGCETTFGPVSINVNDVSGGTIAADQTICSGDDPAAFTSTVDGSGSGAISYKWQYSVDDGDSYSDISEATGATYDSGPLTADRWFKRITYSTLNGKICEAESNVVKIIVNDVSGGTIAADQTICSGDDPAAFTSIADGSGSGTISYKWQYSVDDGTSYSDISGATGATYDSDPLTADRWFKRITYSTLNGKICEAENNVVKIIVNDVSGGTIAADQTICSGDDPAAFTSTVDGSGSGTISYKWQYSVDDGASYSDISGATGATYDSGPLTADRWFKRITYSTL